MKKEFATYEQSLALKELGFDEPCFGYYYTINGRDWKFAEKIEYLRLDDEINIGPNFNILAPLKQQVFRWFRDYFDMSSDIVSRLPFYNNFDSEGNIEDGELKWEYNYRIIHNKDGYKCEVYESNVLNNFTHYEKYEEAENACIDKLIEIVKQK